MSQQKDHEARSLAIGPHTGASPALWESADGAVTPYGSTDGAVTLDVQPAHTEGRRGTFRVAIANGMPRPITVTLTVYNSDEGNGLRTAIEPASPIVIPAHGTAQATISVAPMQARTIPGGTTFDIEVRALYPAQPGPYLAQISGQARFAYAPGRATSQRARWLPLSAVSLLLICGLVVYAVVPKPHSNPPESHGGASSRQPTRAAATPRVSSATSAAGSQTHPSPVASASKTGRAGNRGQGTPGSRRTSGLVMTVSSTLRSQPREDSGRSVLVFKGQRVTDMGVWTPHWQYVDFHGHRGWVLKAHLSGLP